MADYFVNEGNKIGAMPTEFGVDGNGGTTLVEKKLVAGEAIKKGQLVAVYDAWTVKVATAATGDYVIGVAMFDAANGDPVVVETEGLFKLTAGGSITAPALLSPADDGKVVTATAPTVSGGAYVAGTKVVGVALNDASSNGAVYVKFTV